MPYESRSWSDPARSRGEVDRRAAAVEAARQAAQLAATQAATDRRRYASVERVATATARATQIEERLCRARDVAAALAAPPLGPTRRAKVASEALGAP